MGLQFGDLRRRIAEDPLYPDALALATGRTVQCEENRMNLYLIVRHFLGALPFGHIVEFGSYREGSAIFMAKLCTVLHPGMQVYASDAFLDELHSEQVYPHYVFRTPLTQTD